MKSITFIMLAALTRAQIKQMGESCGDCWCPPTFTAGHCAPGLQCLYKPNIMDSPGTCRSPYADENIEHGHAECKETHTTCTTRCKDTTRGKARTKCTRACNRVNRACKDDVKREVREILATHQT